MSGFPEGEEAGGVDEWDEPLTLGKTTSSARMYEGGPLYTVIELAQIEERMNSTVGEIQEWFSLPEDVAITLLKVYHWNKEKLKIDFANDQTTVMAKCGLIPDPTAEVTKSGDHCLICWNPLAGKAVDNVACGHTFCCECWDQYCQTQVKSGKNCLLTRCPQEGCVVVVPKGIFARHLTPALLVDYTKLVCKSFTEENKTIRYCPAPGCKYLVENETLTNVDVACKCGKVYCYGCGEDSHIPCPCELAKKWLAKNSAEGENLTWILANTKQCPGKGCNKFIEKNQGCNHMTCAQCHHEFCWICMGPWSIHGSATGGYYSCNRYSEEIKKNATLKSAEEKAQLAKTELAKYTFYFERFNNHDRAMKLAIKQLGQVEGKVSDLHTRKGYPFTELEFLKTCAESMVGLRRVLKNTYAYAFYLEDKKEKDLFEFQQGRLEENCDRLHQLLEKDLTVFMDEANPDLSPFARYKTEITNVSEVTKKV